MNWKPVAVAALAALVLGCKPDPAPVAAGEPDFSPDRFRAHVAFLADDLLEGREPGTRGHEIAARYIAAQFALLGLKPGGEQGGWYQAVDLVETADAEKGTVTITGPDGARRFVHGQEVMVSGPPGDGARHVKAEAVFVGYGMVDKRLGIDDYAGLDVRGKVAVVLRGIPPGMDSEIAAHLTSNRTRTASEHGAVGVIQVQSLVAAKTFAFKDMLKNADEPETTWAEKGGKPHDEAPNRQVSAVVDSGPASLLFAGSPMTLAQVRQAGNDPKVLPKGFPLKATVEMTIATRSRRYSSPEVIGVIEGADPELRDEYFVLMGHADHLGVKASARPGEDGIYNGALDNAGGVATLLEVARALKAGPPPRRSVLIIANTAEEKGLLGAEFFARHPTVPIGKIVAAIDLDMPVLTYPFADVIAYGGEHSSISAAVRRAGAAMGVAVSPDPMPEQSIFTRSDHYPFVQAGVPALLLATGNRNGGKAAWDLFMDKHYHEASDDLAQPILWQQGARFARLNYLVARDIADGASPPLWYDGDYFADQFAPDRPRAPKPN